MMKELLIRLGLDTKKIKLGITEVQAKMGALATTVKTTMAGATRAVKGFTAAVFSLKSAILVLSGVALVKTADRFNQLQAKIRNAITESENFNDVFNQISKSADRSGVSLNAVAQAFVRLKPAAQDLGVTNKELIKFSETFSKMGALAGANATEMSNAMIQLSQGIASGTLRGDELRSVLEQMPKLGRAIADAMGIPFAALREAASEGQVTSDKVFEAILGKADEVDAMFEKLPPSVERSFQRISNHFNILLGLFNQTIEGTDGVAIGLDGVADILKIASEFLAEHRGEVKAVITAIGDLINTLGGLALGFLDIIGIGEPIRSFFSNFVNNLTKIAIQIARATRDIRKAAAQAKAAWRDLTNWESFNKGIATGKLFDASADIARIDREFEKQKSRLQQIALTKLGGGGGFSPALPPRPSGGGSGGNSAKNTKRTKTEAEKEAEDLKRAAERIYENTRNLAEKRIAMMRELDAARKMYGDIISDDTYKRRVQQIIEETTPDVSEAVEGFSDFFKKQLKPGMEAVNKLEREGVKTSDEFNRKYEEKLRLLEELKTPLEIYNEEQERLNELLADGFINLEQYNAGLELAKERMENGTDAGQEIMGVMRGIGQTTEDALVNVFRDGEFSVRNFFASILEDIARLIFRLTVLNPLLERMNKLMSGGGSFGGIFSSLFGGGGGGGAAAAAASSGSSGFGSAISGWMSSQGVGMFADGGRPPIGRPSIVGENGPEIIYPQTSSFVAPNGTAMGGSGGANVTQNINLSGDITPQVRAEVLRMAPSIKKATLDALKADIIKGGQYSRLVGRLS